MARPRCPICRSRRWHRDRQSGLVVCEEGHILQGYRQEDNEADGPSQHATKRRSVRKNKEKKKRKTADPDLFHGPRLRFLYFQCAQIILRKQIAAIIEIWNLPPELETISRDLWAMFVSLTNLEAEPFKDGNEQGDVPSSPEKNVTHDPLQKIYDALSDSDEDGLPSLGRSRKRRNGNDDPPPTEEEEPPEEEDMEIEDEDDTEGGNEDPKEPQSLKKARHLSKRQLFDPARKLRLQYTLVICYLSCLTLRVPILMKDIIDLATSYKIDYLAALQAIPAEIRKHLDPVKTDAEFSQAHVLPVADSASEKIEHNFAYLVTTFARMLQTRVGITFPDINAAPILFKTVRDLGLPPFIYVTTRRTFIMLNTSMSLNTTSAHNRDFPDLRLAACIIISMKMLWGLDGTTRIPQDNKDMASALPRLNEWLDFAEKLNEDFADSFIPTAGNARDVAALKNSDIDDFLNFFQENLLEDPVKGETVLGTLPVSKNSTKAADRFFPLPTHPSSSSEDLHRSKVAQRDAAIKQFYANMSTPIPGEASTADPLFPGQKYKIFDTKDHVAELPVDYMRVVNLVSKVFGIDHQLIQNRVKLMENNIDRLLYGYGHARVVKDQLPLHGREAQMFGELRAQGGRTPWPKEILPSAKFARQQKEPAVLEPTLQA